MGMRADVTEAPEIPGALRDSLLSASTPDPSVPSEQPPARDELLEAPPHFNKSRSRTLPKNSPHRDVHPQLAQFSEHSRVPEDFVVHETFTRQRPLRTRNLTITISGVSGPRTGMGPGYR
ncbi:hypothetical protein AG1IA_05537 [Rhizoctonia solani AG-1 IA]|uniref:Uncharacterized protein n=1 Tax=Thanatephorus cucumeris (strain AG1-IA) TaxID=983506 RepID=L8WUJ6_THACA|nr:hypothetical protein AG1IA_05537 [Rhizoctonia solani AG-1 IA]